jgi:uncharacterized protein YjbJ (UPF0337 family)
MEWDRIRSNWAHYGALAQARWSEMTPRELELIDGQREVLAGHISMVYGISRDAATIELEAWQRQLADV